MDISIGVQIFRLSKSSFLFEDVWFELFFSLTKAWSIIFFLNVGMYKSKFTSFETYCGLDLPPN